MRLALALALLGFATTTYTEGWLCVAEKLTGFEYKADAKEWRPAVYRTESKFLIRRLSPTDKDVLYRKDDTKWVMTYFGTDILVACVGDPIGDPNDQSEHAKFVRRLLMTCGSEFTFSAESLKFTASDQSGSYLISEERIRNALAASKELKMPHIAIGRCTAL